MVQSVKQVLHDAIQRLASNVDDAYADVQALASHVVDKNRAWLIAHGDEVFPQTQLSEFQQLVDQRANGSPVAHLLGYREFWSLKLNVTPDTLIPRPETEHLIEQVLELPLPTESVVLDFGTGSGAIAIALASEKPAWRFHAIDISPAALEVARENAELNQVKPITFQHADSLQGFDSHYFDLIVSNPPYIAEADPHLSKGDVRFDPATALVSGVDGLDCIRYLVANAGHHLKSNGWLAMEHGYDQAEAVRALLLGHGYDEVMTHEDLAGNERLTVARNP